MVGNGKEMLAIKFFFNKWKVGSSISIKQLFVQTYNTSKKRRNLSVFIGDMPHENEINWLKKLLNEGKTAKTYELALK